MDYEQIRRYMDNDLIEIAPLAYMRGRTLNDAVVILDEGQNATVPQMKMFLTRMGQNARIVVTGDITQVDLPVGVRSGLADAVERLEPHPGRRHGAARPLGHRPPSAGPGDRQRLRVGRARRRARGRRSRRADRRSRRRRSASRQAARPGRAIHPDSRQSDRLGVRRRGVSCPNPSGQRTRSSAIMRSSRTRRQHRQAAAASPRRTPRARRSPPARAV